MAYIRNLSQADWFFKADQSSNVLNPQTSTTAPADAPAEMTETTSLVSIAQQLPPGASTPIKASAPQSETMTVTETMTAPVASALSIQGGSTLSYVIAGVGILGAVFVIYKLMGTDSTPAPPPSSSNSLSNAPESAQRRRKKRK